MRFLYALSCISVFACFAFADIKRDVGAPPPSGAIVLFDGSHGSSAARAEMLAKWVDWRDWPKGHDGENWRSSTRNTSPAGFEISPDPEFPTDTNRVTLRRSATLISRPGANNRERKTFSCASRETKAGRRSRADIAKEEDEPDDPQAASVEVVVVVEAAPAALFVEVVEEDELELDEDKPEVVLVDDSGLLAKRNAVEFVGSIPLAKASIS